jgi:hypothetical protein
MNLLLKIVSRYFFILFCLLIITSLKAQKTSTDIRNINLDIQDNKVIIDYDIVNFNPGQQFNIGIYFLDNEGKSYFPGSLSGDVGENILGGSSRTIIWDVAEDFEELNFTLRPQFIINGMRKGATLGGPNNAYLSMILPGLGDYFVVDHKETIIKPYLRSAAYLAFMGLGIKGLNERERVIVPVNTGNIEQIIVGYTPYGYPIYEDVYDEFGQPVYRYDDQTRTKSWLFNGDFELFFGAAATIWLLDVLYVANKGKKNVDAREYYFQQRVLQLGFKPQGVSLTYTF